MPSPPKQLILLLALGVLVECCSPAFADQPPPLPDSTRIDASISSQGVDLVLAGSPEPNEIWISLSTDGRTYVIDSSSALEVGGDVCANPPGNPNEVICQAPAISSFAFNGGAGDDVVMFGRNVSAAVSLRGGPGNDTLVGGAAEVKLMGGPGEDTLVGRRDEDSLYGGPGEDRLIGGLGDDVCVGGPGEDIGLSCEVNREIP